MSRTSEHREVEFKFRVPDSVDIDLSALVTSVGLDVVSHPERSMKATYFDTPNLSLIRWGITMRHRDGGGDDGWHLKLPIGSSTATTIRDEIHIDAPSDTIPMEFASITAPLVRRQELLPTAIVHTQRQPFELRSGDGSALIEVVDDYVRVAAAADPSDAHAFHEIEVELLHDDATARAAASSICEELLAAGAVSSSVSKAAQAFGPAAADPPDIPDMAFPAPKAPAIDAVQAVFARYVRDLLVADVGVRRGLPDSVHQMRVSCRRLRSSLSTFASVLDPDSVGFLRDELRWLAQELGEVRDIEVQRDRLVQKARDDETRDFLFTALNARLRAATSGAMAALRSDRHDFLLEDLILLVSEPPVQTAAFDPAGTVLTEALHRQWDHFHQSVEKAFASNTPKMWHRARLRGKQMRYASDLAAPVLGAKFARLSKALAKATDLLGHHQDAQVSLAMLADIAMAAPGDIAFRLGLLAAGTTHASDEDIRSFQRVWTDIVALAREAGLD